MTVLTVTNQKGGVGKTALALHLALAGRERGWRVLFVDLDTQGNASVTLARDATLTGREGGSATLFAGEDIEPVPTPAGIDLLHGHQRLDAVDARFTLQDALSIRRKVRGLPYELIVIDTPPAMGLRHVGPMLWCDRCLTPLEPSGYSVAGLSQTLETLALARRLNPGLESRVILNRWIQRSKQQAHYIERIAERVDLAMPYLSLRVAVADALDTGVPVWRFRRATRDTREQWKSLCGGFLGGTGTS